VDSVVSALWLSGEALSCDTMIMMKLPILACSKKLETNSNFCLPHQKPHTKTYKQSKNGKKVPLAEEVSAECLWGEIYGGKNFPEQ